MYEICLVVKKKFGSFLYDVYFFIFGLFWISKIILRNVLFFLSRFVLIIDLEELEMII